MRRYRNVILLSLLLLVLASYSAETFGRNKVQYDVHDWVYKESKNFRLHYPDSNEMIADYAIGILEEAYQEYEKILGHTIREKVPVVLYPTKSGFQETNITMQILPDGVGGFTEMLRKRVVIPYDGSYEEFRHVLRHELVHAFQFDILYGENLGGFLSASRYFDFPLWIAEGQAEYLSSFWDEDADMYMQNLIFTSNAIPLEYLGGYQVYKQGQSVMRYIAEKYGVRKVGELLRSVRTYPSSDKALEETIGINSEKLYEDWLVREKRRYFREFPSRELPGEIAKNLTDKEPFNSSLNLMPGLSPDGNKIVFISDKDDYVDLYIMDLINKDFQRIARGQRSGDIESFNPLRSKCAWSFDNRFVAYIGKREGKDAIFLYDYIKGKKIDELDFPNIDQINATAFSPAGDYLVFSGMIHGKQDLYLYSFLDSTLERLTDDTFDDREPFYATDGRIYFSSDRPALSNKLLDSNPIDYEFGRFNLFVIDSTKEIIPITVDESDANSPHVLEDGRMVFTSMENGARNVYSMYIDKGEKKPMTNLIGGVGTISVSGDGEKVAFVSTYKGSYDIFLADELIPLDEMISKTYHYEFPESLKTPLELFNDEFPDTNGAEILFAEDIDTVYEKHHYKPSFAADLANVNVGYDAYYGGLAGLSYLSLSDLLGNHRILIYTDLVYTLDNSNLIVNYGNFYHRYNWYLSAYYLNKRYQDYEYQTFGDNLIGADFGVEYPFSQFTRVQLMTKCFRLSRELFEVDDGKTTSFNVNTSFSFIQDNALWKHTGPIVGTRKKLTLQYVPKIGENSHDFVALEGDIRFYNHFGNGYGFASRFAAGSAFGNKPKRYLIGGTENWFYPQVDNEDFFNVTDMYFSRMIVPLRGYGYFNKSGNNYMAVNLEFRYPFIEYLQLGFPPITIAGFNGGLFLDMATAFDDFEELRLFKNSKTNDLLAGYGFGIRSGLAFMYINYELGWQTDFKSTSDKPIHYISIGTEF